MVYTPTEGDAIQNYSRLFRRPEGCFLNIHDKDRIRHDLAQWGQPDDIDYIVVTGAPSSPPPPPPPFRPDVRRGCFTANSRWQSDGEEILGIGDQGVGGILISVAKLLLTTVCAGIHPNRVLPVVLDCGTDNQDLLDDELYLGLKQKRVRGQDYDAFVDEFVRSARELFPRAYLHFEDFGLPNGEFPIMQICSLQIGLPLVVVPMSGPRGLFADCHGLSPKLVVFSTSTALTWRVSTMTSRAPGASPSPPSWPGCT